VHLLVSLLIVLPLAADGIRLGVREGAVRLCVGDDWAQDHHDVEVMDEAGRVLAARRLPEGVAGIGQLHELIGRFVPAGGDAQVQVGIETDRGPWVAALIAAGYTVFAVNPLQASRYRGRHGVSGAKSDSGDAHMLADVVRTDAHQLRPAAGDSPAAGAVKVLARTHKTLIWERAAVVLRLRAQLREYFPAAVAAFEDLDAPDALQLLAKAPDPARAARLTRAQVSAVLKRAGRYKITERADAILAALRSPQLGQPPALTAAYAATVRSLVAVITALNEQVASLQGQVEAHFGQHPDAEIYLSQPGLGAITGARVLGEFGDDPHRYACAKARRNYAGTSPITRASGKRKIVAARYVRNGRLIDALMIQAFAARRVSPGARAFYDVQRAKGLEHNDALRRLASRLVGILHGCLKTRTCYDEATAWGHRENIPQSEAAA
jgi:Transposase/Transposase IS116/IS110/IS902 family